MGSVRDNVHPYWSDATLEEWLSGFSQDSDKLA